MDSYIVRIYRWDTKGSAKIAGVVEKVGAKKRTAFHSAQELVAMLRGATTAPGRKK